MSCDGIARNCHRILGTYAEKQWKKSWTESYFAFHNDHTQKRSNISNVIKTKFSAVVINLLGKIPFYQKTTFSVLLFRQRKNFRRLVTKSGESNVSNGRVTGPGTGTFVGIFTWLVDAKWRWTGLIFFASFYITWTLFAILFWVICYFHGDFEMQGQGITSIWLLKSLNIIKIRLLKMFIFAGESVNNGSIPCIENIRDFTSIFLFSLEIQTTIGFGFSRVTEQCGAAIFTLTVQVRRFPKSLFPSSRSNLNVKTGHFRCYNRSLPCGRGIC